MFNRPPIVTKIFGHTLFKLRDLVLVEAATNYRQVESFANVSLNFENKIGIFFREHATCHVKLLIHVGLLKLNQLSDVVDEIIQRSNVIFHARVRRTFLISVARVWQIKNLSLLAA